MKVGVMVIEGPYQHQASDSAYHFVKAAMAKGHEIVGVFFYTDGVNNANKFMNPPGERNLSKLWNEIGAQGVDLVACTACAKFRGMTNDIRVENVRLSGLGQLAEMMGGADRFVTFAD